MNNSKKYLFLIVMILFVVIGVSLAYFGITIIGNDTAKGNKVVTGNLELTFTDTNEISLENAFPGDSFTKTISVKNTGTKEVSYNLVWTELTNEIINNELVIEASCKNLNSSNTEEGTCNSISQKAVSSASNITSNIPIKPGYTQEYTIKITFIDTGKPQNYNKNKTFEGKLGITESSAKTVYCTFDGELTQGTEYVNGQYTYRYMQERNLGVENNNAVYSWKNIDNDGWGVTLSDKESTAVVTSSVCSYINDKPVISMALMFSESQAEKIDLSSFNTSNVTNMLGMFYKSQATTLDLSSFNTSNVINMSGMFNISQVLILELSSFDTSNVINMIGMFAGSQATTLDLSSFVTSNVTNMHDMFSSSQATLIDISSFNTPKVIDMSRMFYSAKNLKTIYASEKFNTDNVTSSGYMFSNCTSLVGGAGTTYDSTKTDKVYAHIDGGTSNPGYFIDIADKPKEPESFATDSWSTIAKAVRNNNISKYNVGDTKTIDMGTYGTHTVRIANKSTPSECSTSGFSQSACGFVLEFADIITKHNMNPAGEYNGTQYDYGHNIGGWPASSMYTFVNNDIYNAIPSEIKNAIIDTTVVSSHGDKDTANFTSTDKLYLLSTAEVWAQGSSNTIDDDTARDNTRQLDYYKNLGVTTSNKSGAIKKNGTSASDWWLRTAGSSGTTTFYYVGNSGDWFNYPGNNTNGVSPAFRIG